MSKVTSKLQITIPRALAKRHRLRPGDEIEWVSAGDTIRIEPIAGRKPLSVEARVKLFDEATKRLRRRRWRGATPKGRGWTREELYDRGRSR
jgi:AbrB family looped-hinge helix DNA binding protein